MGIGPKEGKHELEDLVRLGMPNRLSMCSSFRNLSDLLGSPKEKNRAKEKDSPVVESISTGRWAFR